MAYANATTKRDQMLAQLVANMSAIAAPAYAHDVKRVFLYEGHRLVLGGENPAIAVVPIGDARIRSLACAADEYRMTVQLAGVLRVDPSTNTWKNKIGLLAGDIQQAIANDRQLTQKAVYIEVDEVDISDAAVSGNRNLAVCVVSATIIYRVSVADVTL
tara:strand:+ start:36895 stop:37371 length:477 start_codon:yes stop_codon:yes gene_type:complete